MKRLGLVVAAVGLGLACNPVAAKDKSAEAIAPVPAGPAAFADSSAAGLAATKRVAISSVVIQFQASTNAVDGPGDWFRMFQSKATSETVLAWTDFDQQMQSQFADFAYSKLQADLTAAGYEVVPEAQVKASASYAALIQLAGMPQHTQFGNAMGDAYFVGPSSLQPYIPYQLEGGAFESPVSYIGWTSKLGGKSKTPGGPSLFSIVGNWKIPGLETALAKELNAHVVKATYVVTLGKAMSKRKSATYIHSSSVAAGTSSSTVVTATANAYAEPSLMAEQTHIAFRSPTGSGKWQKVSTTKQVPPKDGDVSVYLTSPLIGGTDFFDLASDGGKRKDGFLSQGGPKIKFMYFATLRDPQGYKTEVDGMITEANKRMLGLIKQ